MAGCLKFHGAVFRMERDSRAGGNDLHTVYIYIIYMNKVQLNKYYVFCICPLYATRFTEL